ncbi:hypothetical protein P43SY_003784 [Pythium insidiosum]|uniref:Uncharacterized protein n=1 Tax=Pythium insidiosum TaxID=114742 RepID=A0AAD5LMB5_PYTIN|nr:hypothetical protein P43SY_003784 [Pythium insidiosum]
MMMEALLQATLDDDILRDVRADARLSELELLVAQEDGRLVELSLELLDGRTLLVRVLPEWTVHELKSCVRRSVEVNLRRRQTADAARRLSW